VPVSDTPQRWDPAVYARNGRFVSDLGAPVLDLLRPREGERILDLGCGDGALTETLLAIGCRVVGVDSSPHQVAAARARGVDPGCCDPWDFPTLGEYRARLESARFHVAEIALFDRPTRLPGDVVGWLETFAQSFLANVPVAERPDFLVEVRDRLQPSLCDEQGRWTADYVRLRFSAYKL